MILSCANKAFVLPFGLWSFALSWAAQGCFGGVSKSPDEDFAHGGKRGTALAAAGVVSAGSCGQPDFLASAIYGPSYVSFETALAWHGLIPERVEEIVSATLKRATFFEAKAGRYRYRPVPVRIYPIGIERVEDASMPQAVLVNLHDCRAGCRSPRIVSMVYLVSIHSRRFLPALVALLLCIGSAWAASETPAPPVTPLRAADSPHPQIIYWVWDSVPKDDSHLKELDRIAKFTPFTHVSIYLHNGFGFNDPEKVKPALAKTVARAHELGLKVIVSPYFPAHTPKELKGRLSGKALDAEVTLDGNGTATLEVRAETLREKKPVASSLLKAYAFRKTGDGFYDPASLRELRAEDHKVTSLGPDALRIEVKQDPKHAGETVFVLTRHDYSYGDLFSDFWPEQFGKMLDTWADIPLDGIALDEFRYLSLPWGKPFSGRWYSEPMAKAYRERFNRSMEDDLFANRYAPEGQPSERAAAINRYFDLMAPQPGKVEHALFEHARKLFGKDIFVGFHNTWHNGVSGDEVWGTGANWWNLDRAYPQIDETLPFPMRLGVGAAYPKPVFYNMYYSELARKKKLDERDSYTGDAFLNAQINGRVNYLGIDQPQEWGIPFDDALLERIGRTEQRIRLLNLFDGPRPDTRILVLFGFPSLVNWFPNPAARSLHDINNSLEIEKKADTLWKAGIPCAFMSSTVIDSGKLTLGKDGKPTINGHTFDALVFIGPEYSKPGTLEFLKKYVDSGGKLILDGVAMRGFDGNPIGSDYAAIAKAAIARECTPAAVAKFGINQDWPKEGSRLEDGSVIMVDRATFETDAPHTFSFRIGSHEYKVVASGLLAFKATPDGSPLKLAAPRFVSLERDGKMILQRNQPADTAVEWTSGEARPLAEGLGL